MCIDDPHGEYVADDFFEDMMNDTAAREVDDPILALRKLVERDNRAEPRMKSKFMLAASIKVFNAWHKHETLGRRWMLQVDENFPALEVGEQQAEAAE